ncbi:DM13 domain-containing protein [Panacibacter ginsenosidivorans]|uniref:DM13 domain-containing protein n=1 Tax=Panacibacter ginsenosidivorans TaxID=1813871 RepID=A0A5B8V5Y5_9BACT|nr:DM13 domain-containing protein [Panacibacter ginsenosidivorans]QEC66036.1 DM13 domain-containing protein [Panacibacter ginsenosidivorans]
MKKIFTILSIGLFMTACSKQNAAPTTPVNDMVDSTTELSYTGSFMNGPYGTVTGIANIYADSSSYVLALTAFQTSNGPDLHVYLSQEEQPIHFVDLGKLKSTNGNQVYNIPTGTDLETYKYALIHCQQYNHLFGSTLLEEQ